MTMMMMNINDTDDDDDNSIINDDDKLHLFSQHEDVYQAKNLAARLRPVLVTLSLSLIMILFIILCQRHHHHLLYEVGDHDDNMDPLLPHHSPEGWTRACHWTLVVIFKVEQVRAIGPGPG